LALALLLLILLPIGVAKPHERVMRDNKSCNKATGLAFMVEEEKCGERNVLPSLLSSYVTCPNQRCDNNEGSCKVACPQFIIAWSSMTLAATKEQCKYTGSK
jgi:hypothetical protein